MSLFEAIRNNIVTVTTSTGFLLRLWVNLLAAKAKQRRALVTLTPTTERRSRLLRGSFVTVTFPRGLSVTPRCSSCSSCCVSASHAAHIDERHERQGGERMRSGMRSRMRSRMSSTMSSGLALVAPSGVIRPPLTPDAVAPRATDPATTLSVITQSPGNGTSGIAGLFEASHRCLS